MCGEQSGSGLTDAAAIEFAGFLHAFRSLPSLDSTLAGIPPRFGPPTPEGRRYRLRWTRRNGRRFAAAFGAIAPRPLRGRRVAGGRGEQDGLKQPSTRSPAGRDQERRTVACQDAELDLLRNNVNCTVLLERSVPAWRLDRKGSTRRALKYRRGEGEILIVNHDGHGWWDPRSPAKGDIFDLVQFLDPGLNFGQVRRVLRALVGLSPAFPEALRSQKRSGRDRPLAERWQTRPRLRPGTATWRYLTDERRLPPGILAAADLADALREGPYGSAWFAHRDEGGRLTHIEIRGPDFKGSLRGGRKTLFRLQGGRRPARLALTEGPIDALSLAALEDMRADTLYAATGGGMGPGTIEALARELATMATFPNALLHSAADANAAGERYALRHAELGAAAGVAFARLTPTGGADWNDVLKLKKPA